MTRKCLGYSQDHGDGIFVLQKKGKRLQGNACKSFAIKNFSNAIFFAITKLGYDHSIANTSMSTQQWNMVPYFYAVSWLRPASSGIIVIRCVMQALKQPGDTNFNRQG